MNLIHALSLRRAGATATTALVLVLVSACGGGADAGPATQASTVTIEDPWVAPADSGTTAAFGTLRNASDAEVVVVSATSEATSSMELHEMASGDDGQMTMRPKAGGFTVPADGTHVLDPTADHLMFMGLTKPIKTGDDVAITLTFADSSSMSFTAPARATSGMHMPSHGG